MISKPNLSGNLLAFLLLLSTSTTFSQDKTTVSFGKVTSADFVLPESKIIDSNTNAVIIADIGSITFTGNKYGWFNYIFNRKTRIKILNKKAIDLATIKILLSSAGTGIEIVGETMADFNGATYTLEDGKVIQTKLNKNDIFEDHLNKHLVEKKITLPSIKDGCIIEYSYNITSAFTRSLPTWEFQTNLYPCLWSELNVEIPSLLSYAIQRNGFDDLFINSSKDGAKNYQVSQKVASTGSYGQGSKNLMVSVNTYSHRWVIKDVPALNMTSNDVYISSPRNYLDKIEFQQYHIYEGQGGAEKNEMAKNWKTASAELLNESGFGAVINVDFSWADAKLSEITDNSQDKLECARKIYYYIKNNFTCTNYQDYHARKSLVDIFNAKTGNVGEINLLLMCLLREVQIAADPVLISTRGNGYFKNSFSNLNKFDYVVCQANIKGETYCLDACNPYLGFGKLPGYCYNGYGRVISEVHPDSVNLFNGALKEPNIVNVFITNEDGKPGTITGGFELNPNEFESYNIRKQVMEKGKDAFFQSQHEALESEITTENAGIDSLNLTEFPVKVHYDFSLKNNGAETIYFNPVIGWSYRTNPFKTETRKYPIEMLYPIDDMYILSMEIPTGYAVEELPKSVKVAFNNNDGFFEYVIQKSESNVQLRAHVRFQRANFSASDYNSLRDFYDFIIKKQSEQIVFKKKK